MFGSWTGTNTIISTLIQKRLTRRRLISTHCSRLYRGYVSSPAASCAVRQWEQNCCLM